MKNDFRRMDTPALLDLLVKYSAEYTRLHKEGGTEVQVLENKAAIIKIQAILESRKKAVPLDGNTDHGTAYSVKAAG